jgi:alpha-glucuronidase
MGKYASWAEFERNVPITYTAKATPEAYRTGMNGIAPTGLHVKEGRVHHYGAGVEGKGDEVVAGYKRAMFE